jgi:hypothetical protein
MWTRLANVAPSVALCLTGFAAHAQSANESASGLESCFRAARLADTTCSKLSNDPAQHVDCFNKARTAQLECLERVLSEARAPSAATGSFSETAPPAPPVEAAPPDAPLERPDPKEADRTDRPESPVGIAPADEAAAERSSPSPKSAPASVAATWLKRLPEQSGQTLPGKGTTAPTASRLDSERDDVAGRLQPAHYRGHSLDIGREGRTEYAFGSMPRPTYRAFNSNGWRMGSATRQRPHG